MGGRPQGGPLLHGLRRRRMSCPAGRVAALIIVQALKPWALAASEASTLQAAGVLGVEPGLARSERRLPARRAAVAVSAGGGLNAGAVTEPSGLPAGSLVAALGGAHGAGSGRASGLPASGFVGASGGLHGAAAGRAAPPSPPPAAARGKALGFPTGALVEASSDQGDVSGLAADPAPAAAQKVPAPAPQGAAPAGGKDAGAAPAAANAPAPTTTTIQAPTASFTGKVFAGFIIGLVMGCGAVVLGAALITLAAARGVAGVSASPLPMRSHVPRSAREGVVSAGSS